MAPPRGTPEQSTPQVADRQCHQTVTERQPPLAGVEHEPAGELTACTIEPVAHPGQPAEVIRRNSHRAPLLDLLRGFDLDAVLTSDHEWCTYAELDGIAIHQLLTDDVDKAVTTARFIWTGTGPGAGRPA
jgi:hypothetical protein